MTKHNYSFVYNKFILFTQMTITITKVLRKIVIVKYEQKI